MTLAAAYLEVLRTSCGCTAGRSRPIFTVRPQQTHISRIDSRDISPLHPPLSATLAIACPPRFPIQDNMSQPYGRPPSQSDNRPLSSGSTVFQRSYSSTNTEQSVHDAANPAPNPGNFVFGGGPANPQQAAQMAEQNAQGTVTWLLAQPADARSTFLATASPYVRVAYVRRTMNGPTQLNWAAQQPQAVQLIWVRGLALPQQGQWMAARPQATQMAWLSGLPFNAQQTWINQLPPSMEGTRLAWVSRQPQAFQTAWFAAQRQREQAAAGSSTRTDESPERRSGPSSGTKGKKGRK